MPSTRSSAPTKCISEVPGLAKQTSTPPFTRVRTRLSAPFMPFSTRFEFEGRTLGCPPRQCHRFVSRLGLLFIIKRLHAIVHPMERPLVEFAQTPSLASPWAEAGHDIAAFGASLD